MGSIAAESDGGVAIMDAVNGTPQVSSRAGTDELVNSAGQAVIKSMLEESTNPVRFTFHRHSRCST
jgi:hypothetical protein